MKLKKRKCPNCNSSRTSENSKYFVCHKCGFINKKNKK